MAKFRLARDDDEQGIFVLSSFFNKSDETKSPQEIRAHIQKAVGDNLLWIAEDDDKIIGYIFCELFNEEHHNFPDSIFISELFVQKEYRGAGIGSRLMHLVLQNRFPEIYKYFSITHNPGEKHLTKFYESFGFKVVGTTDAGNIKMVKYR
ncbi:MAG: GNAT family N-acetyltransferase [Parcubacteria group bacterium]|nr:GNAT family N-acetyltransferase [Parcubacteria group bacterium]